MSLSNPSSRDTYQFSAEPKPVKSRSKYRDANEPRQSDYDQLQNDPRVRGAQAKGATPTKGSTTNVGNKVVEKTPREEAPVEDVYAALSERSTLDESKIIPYYYVDKPPTPEFKPLEPGVDVFTQVEDRELFDFILEVEPVLQVLVGKTIEQAQLELCEEDDRIEQVRHKMAFEKKRNAELMVTQRKEALHLRKEDEKKRREKQYGIERDQKTGAHKKYISRLLAKNVMNGMGLASTNVLADKGVLCYNVKNEMRKDYVPSLVQNTISFINENTAVQRFIEELMSIPTKQYRDAHARSVQKEVDRLQKIADDKKAEQERLEAERKKRRERRRKLRLYFAKTALLNKIQASVVNRAVEVPNPFAAEITDVFPTGKEAVATVGGLIGELWVVLESLQAESQVELKPEQIIEILVKILNEKHQQKEFPIYLDESSQQLIQAVTEQMSEDLISFNQNKSARIDEITEQLGHFNLFQNLHTLHNLNILNHSVFNALNKALISIYFTSVDYKIPEKKVKEPEQVQQPQDSVAASNVVEGGDAQGDAQGEPQAQSEVQEQNQEQKQDQNQENQNQDQSESQAQGQSNLLQEPVLTQGDNSSNVVSEPPEEEFKLPEVTALEQAMVLAKKKLKLVFVNDWDFRKDCDAVVRFRAPLVREVKSSKNELETQEDEKPQQQAQAAQPQAQDPAKANKDKKKADKAAPTQAVAEPQEDIKEKARMLMENEDFIEPYDGTTYEAEKLELPVRPVGEGEALKIYNAGLVEGVYVAQINERAQADLRKELIAVMKEYVPEWKELDNEVLLAKIYEKSKENEKAVLETLISDPEAIPLFDVENI